MFQAFDLPQSSEFELKIGYIFETRLGACSERPLEPPAVLPRHHDGCSNHARYDWCSVTGNALPVRHALLPFATTFRNEKGASISSHLTAAKTSAQ